MGPVRCLGRSRTSTTVSTRTSGAPRARSTRSCSGTTARPARTSPSRTAPARGSPCPTSTSTCCRGGRVRDVDGVLGGVGADVDLQHSLRDFRAFARIAKKSSHRRRQPRRDRKLSTTRAISNHLVHRSVAIIARYPPRASRIASRRDSAKFRRESALAEREQITRFDESVPILPPPASPPHSEMRLCRGGATRLCIDDASARATRSTSASDVSPVDPRRQSQA